MPDQNLDTRLASDLRTYLASVNNPPLPRGVQDMTVFSLTNRRRTLRTIFASAAVVAAAATAGVVALAAHGGGGPVAVPGPAHRSVATATPSAISTPSAIPTAAPPTPAAVVTKAQLLAVARQADAGYPVPARACGQFTLARCPYTPRLVARIQALLPYSGDHPGGIGFDLSCGCQQPVPVDYAATVTPTGGTVVVLFQGQTGASGTQLTLTMIASRGALLVDDITYPPSAGGDIYTLKY